MQEGKVNTPGPNEIHHHTHLLLQDGFDILARIDKCLLMLNDQDCKNQIKTLSEP